MILKYIRNKKMKYLVMLIFVVISSLLHTYVIQAFNQSHHLLQSGFTGTAMLINLLTKDLISVSLGIILLNIPAALLCYFTISKPFVLFSTLQFTLTSCFLKIFDFQPIFDDIILTVIFGGVLNGCAILLALNVNASSGGTDFITQYFSFKTGKSLWKYVFIFNLMLLTIFGILYSSELAAYSIIFQFISNKTITTYYTFYNKVSLQIMTTQPALIIEKYTNITIHGITCTNGYGGYSGKQVTILTAVVSKFEVAYIINELKKVDSEIIINVYHTDNFVGKFIQSPL